MKMPEIIATIAVIISVLAFAHTLIAWRRSFRPIVTAMVRTAQSGELSTIYNLVLLNSGSIPAKNITLHIHDQGQLEASLLYADETNRSRFLACFEPNTKISVLHNGASVSCSFGFTGVNTGFWKPGAKFTIRIRYEGWFSHTYCEYQIIKIVDSNSFTGRYWGTKAE
ncbi:hypothetical protein [Ochrobactrum sp. SFR4]|uniref:hypothetical protein n=1 Tax=Ochrobactrum sp. SFR4 TaxID=2717368 RepID=UPI001C8CD236|nr:hypothetical protein [Ochrobactrum sp. SFR4]MBX8826892.1 hypothetical protein [Ochrobactrum sp. SFR4]